MVKNPPATAGDIRDTGSIPEFGRPPAEGNGNPLQHSCLENPMDRGAWRATVYGVAMIRTRLSDFTFTLSKITPKLRSTFCHTYKTEDKTTHQLSKRSSTKRSEDNLFIVSEAREPRTGWVSKILPKRAMDSTHR